MPAPRLIDIKQPLASLLDEVRPSRHVLVAVRKGHDLKALHALLDELAIINREVNGLIYLGDQVAAPASASAAPAPAAEVIEPEAEEETAEETSSEVAESKPSKETEDTSNSKKSNAKASSKKGKK